MGDHRADIKIKFSMYGETRDADMWINWSAEDNGVDQRVIDFFEQSARDMYVKGYLPLLQGEVLMTSRKEIVELAQDLAMDDTWLPAFLERLKEKHPGLYAELTNQAKARIEGPKHD